MNLKRLRGEIWQVDMGIAGKVRPFLLLTDYPANDELALVTVIPHTTARDCWEFYFHICIKRAIRFEQNAVADARGIERLRLFSTCTLQQGKKRVEFFLQMGIVEL